MNRVFICMDEVCLNRDSRIGTCTWRDTMHNVIHIGFMEIYENLKPLKMFSPVCRSGGMRVAKSPDYGISETKAEEL